MRQAIWNRLARPDAGEASLSEDLQSLLYSLRRHLGMDVAFISEFCEGRRVLRVVDAGGSAECPKQGHSDPQEASYCRKIVDHDLSGIIPDASLHPVTRAMPVTRELNIGAYLGVPLQDASGEVFGTFCCYRHLPDASLDRRDLALLRIVADIAGRQIEKRFRERREEDAILARIEQVLEREAVAIVYQPIYHLGQRRVVGYESLARFSAEPYRTPDVWFAEARRVGAGERLEMLALRQALAALEAFPESRYLAFNVSPDHVISGAVARALAGRESSRIVLEVTEHDRIEDYAAFREAVAPLRARGVRLAIDDAGAGYASFQHILELDADILKLDISLIRELHRDRRRRALAASLIAFARTIGCEVIAEGVECREELETLREHGVNKVQGYHIGRPMPLEAALGFAPADG
ncbi:sensor domain-containing phosphodiesterase [Halomonas koreensis]|uniref:EAL domain-containing protein n=1 Tax=Halomonas koreensis TaxID=245385 RepID=A0ABU1G2F1_9GAMM|nr:EAL domain-containing protein [Halomonas koreensis]MDR5867112.1 EAL domain-containing protein [Halomonas koreensis]